MTSVAVNTYTHSVTYVADNILKSMKDIIRLSGLDPTNLIGEWETNMRALRTWLDSRRPAESGAGDLSIPGRTGSSAAGISTSSMDGRLAVTAASGPTPISFKYAHPQGGRGAEQREIPPPAGEQTRPPRRRRLVPSSISFDGRNGAAQPRHHDRA